ncbi:MAG: leucine-rich repeat domain-containing protein [Clostridia bacterium]|nr:leucine-rich repeat domain-containing protein [Clostridia bacterium]
MKKRLFVFTILIVAIVALFAVSASAAEWTYKDEAGTVYLTLTIDDSTKIVTEYEGKFPMWDEDNNPLTWYVIATDTTNNVKTVKSFVSTDPAYTNHGGGYFRFIQSANFKVEGYPVPTKENVVSMNMPNDMGITAFSNYSAVNFQAGVDYTPDKLEILFLRCPNTLTNTTRLVQATKVLEVEFDKNSTFTELSYLSFHNCQSLRKVNIPASVVTICSSGSDGNGRAFFNCGYLEQLTFDEGSNLKEIQGGAFKGAKIKEIQLPASMTTINNNVFGYTIGLEIVRFPETFTHFVNLNSNGTIRNDHHSFAYTPDNPTSVKEYYLPATFYATKPDVSYRSSYAFYSGGNVKFFYCGTLEQFDIARENFKNSTSSYSDNNGNFTNATPVDYAVYAEAIKLDPSAYSDADYVIYNYNSCDAFHKGIHDIDTDCTTGDSCKNGCGLTQSASGGHNNATTLTYENGFTQNGLLCKGCINEGCSVKTEEIALPIFIANGYSISPSGTAINGGYSVNLDALKDYEDINGDITYGIVIANAEKFDGKSFFDADKKVNTTKALQVEINNEYSNFNCSIEFGTITNNSLKLIICAYVIEGDNVTFIQAESGEAVDSTLVTGGSFKSVTLNYVAALPTSKEEEIA